MCGIGEFRGTLTGMVEESSDAAVGERIAEMRKFKHLTQDEFLALMEASGVTWTRTILSRIEGGQRALKAAELFIVAEALGIQSDDLNPRANDLAYAIQRQRAKYSKAVANVTRTEEIAEAHRAGLVALVLTSELRSGRTDFVVDGTPARLVYDLAFAMDKTAKSDLTDVHKVLGVDDSEFREQLGRKAFSTKTLKALGSDQYARSAVRYGWDNEIYGKLLLQVYPDLKFTGDQHVPLSVTDLDLGLTDGG